MRISEYKNVFAKGYTSNWYEEVFVIKKVRNTVPWTCYVGIYVMLKFTEQPKTLGMTSKKQCST